MNFGDAIESINEDKHINATASFLPQQITKLPIQHLCAPTIDSDQISRLIYIDDTPNVFLIRFTISFRCETNPG
jgi:hypothetical protein